MTPFDVAMKLSKAQLLDLLADWSVAMNPKAYAGHRDDAVAYWKNNAGEKQYLAMAAVDRGLAGR